MRRLAAATAFLLTACTPMGVPVEPGAGPTLVLDVTNASNSDVALTYEFEAPGTSGMGETLLAPCRHEASPVSRIKGDYRIVVDGETSFEGTVPDRASAETFLVVPIHVGPDGEVEITAPGVAHEPLDVSEAIPGCG